MKTIIDLTLPLQNSMRGVEIEPAKTVAKNAWNASTYKLYSHAGTHMDAPIHFDVSKETIDDLSLEHCIGDAWIVDLNGIEAKSLITLNQISEDIFSSFKPGESLIIKTGWSKYLGTDKYRNELPRISEEMAEWCVQNSVKMLAVEPPSVADVNNIKELTQIHKILLSGGITIIEGICNLDAINEKKCRLYAIPLKVYKGDGAPARVFVEI